MTPILQKIFNRLVVFRLSRYLEVGIQFPATQSAYRSGLGTCNVMLTMIDQVQLYFDAGREFMVVHINLLLLIE